ncbi:hypothetical protein B484DRAFT_12835 [Ochromonadaceae sp. CCMP2298]|nr:hypothetical protein B484DRAFT_12835 [Ochromonadaceae sp. CCMP2298]
MSCISAWSLFHHSIIFTHHSAIPPFHHSVPFSPGEVKECYENLAAEQQMILDLRRQATLNQGMSRMLCSSLTHGNLSSMYGKMLKKMHLPINHSRMRPTAHSAPRLSPMRPIRLAPVPKGTVPMSKAQSPKAPAIGKLQPTWSTSRIVTAGLSSFRRSFMGAKSPKVADVEVDILDKPATPHPRSNKPLIRKTSSFMRSLSAVTDLSLTHTSGEKYELKGERSPPAEALSKPQLKTEEKTGTEDVDMEDRALMQRRLRIQTTPSTTTPAPLLRSPKHSPKHGLHIEVSEEISAASLRRQQTINEEKSAARQERLDIEESRKSVQESRKTMPGSRKSLQEGGKSVLEEAERSDRIRTREVELRTEYPNCLSPVVQHNGEAL